MGPVRYCFVAILIAFPFIQFSNNNACSSFWSYLNIHFSNNCYYNPDLDRDSPEIIKHHIGLFEDHKIETEDGYLLTIFRIPSQNVSKGVIYLFHPLFFDANYFVAQGEESLAFKFWKRGYDVWIGNARGSTHSKKHKTLDDTNPEFWNFSYFEWGHYDTDAVVKYIRAVTKKKIIFLGVSGGANAGVVYSLSRSKIAAESLSVVVAVAPVLVTNHVTSALNSLRPIGLAFKKWYDDSETYGAIFGASSWFVKIIHSVYFYSPFKQLVLLLLNPFAGYTWNELDPNLANSCLLKMKEEISLKTIFYGYQLNVPGDEFQYYDYGPTKNSLIYHSTSPPVLLFNSTKVPIFFVCSKDDSLSTCEDQDDTYSQLSESSKQFGQLQVEGLNHADFGFGKHRMKKVYNKIFAMLDTLGH